MVAGCAGYFREMPRYQNLIFDFDGTLADTVACIVAAANRAFVEHGLGDLPREAITRWMGVPLERSIALMHGRELEAALVMQTIATYRRHYAELAPGLIGLYPGVRELLEATRRAGCRNLVATSKKTAIAWANAATLGIDGLLDGLVGSDMLAAEHYKPHRRSVDDVLAQVGERLDDPAMAAGCIMIGDAVFDLEMGKNAGIDTCAVLWGAGDHSELAAARPTFTAETVPDLAALVLGHLG